MVSQLNPYLHSISEFNMNWATSQGRYSKHLAQLVPLVVGGAPILMGKVGEFCGTSGCVAIRQKERRDGIVWDSGFLPMWWDGQHVNSVGAKFLC